MIGQKVKSNALSISQGNRQMISISRTYFPNDALLIELWEDLTFLAEQMDRNEISTEKYHELRVMRWDIFDDANRQRHNYAQQQEAQQRRSQFLGNFLGSLGQSMQRTNPTPINCSTTSMPGVLTTNCR